MAYSLPVPGEPLLLGLGGTAGETGISGGVEFEGGRTLTPLSLYRRSPPPVRVFGGLADGLFFSPITQIYEPHRTADGQTGTSARTSTASVAAKANEKPPGAAAL
jgi:hypothetical protein